MTEVQLLHSGDVCKRAHMQCRVTGLRAARFEGVCSWYQDLLQMIKCQ